MAAVERQIKLTQIVQYFIDESNQTQAEFRRLWTLAFRGLVYLGFNTMWQPKTVRIQLNDNLTADLPADYLNWVKVGVFNAFGEIQTLAVNSNLTTYKDLSPNRTTDIQADVPSPAELVGSPYYYNFFWDGGYRHLYGVQAGLITPGECRIDEQNGVILFNPSFSFSDIVLEYLSSPELDDDFEVDVRLQEAMISWLRWKDVQSSPKVGMGEKRDRRRAFYDDLKICKTYLKPFRLQEWEEVAHSNNNLKLKA